MCSTLCCINTRWTCKCPCQAMPGDAPSLVSDRKHGSRGFEGPTCAQRLLQLLTVILSESHSARRWVLGCRAAAWWWFRYNAGHIHDYCSTWPICFDPKTHRSAICEDNKDNFINPKGAVHVTEGNGGVPGVAGVSTLTKIGQKTEWGRTHGTGGAYGPCESAMPAVASPHHPLFVTGGFVC